MRSGIAVENGWANSGHRGRDLPLAVGLAHTPERSGAWAVALAAARVAELYRGRDKPLAVGLAHSVKVVPTVRTTAGFRSRPHSGAFRSVGGTYRWRSVPPTVTAAQFHGWTTSWPCQQLERRAVILASVFSSLFPRARGQRQCHIHRGVRQPSRPHSGAFRSVGFPSRR